MGGSFPVEVKGGSEEMVRWSCEWFRVAAEVLIAAKRDLDAGRVVADPELLAAALIEIRALASAVACQVDEPSVEDARRGVLALEDMMRARRIHEREGVDGASGNLTNRGA